MKLLFARKIFKEIYFDFSSFVAILTGRYGIGSIRQEGPNLIKLLSYE